MQQEFIANTEQLNAFVQRAASSSVLAIDTEFLREKTYFPRLCLLQMATDDEIVLVDPFGMEGISPIVPLLEAPGIMKIFHAGKQDLEIIHHETGLLPRPVFDTQIAAALLGATQQIGLAALVSAECGAVLDKTDSFTDWSARPLSASQLSYAAADVRYLPDLYRKMSGRLEELGRLAWLQPDFEELIDPANFHDDPRERFRRLKRASHLSRRQLAAARELAAWREIAAQRRDIPRKWVLTDEQVVEICRREPKTVDDLFVVRGVKEHLCMRDARKVLELVRKGLSLPPEEWPVLAGPSRNERNVDAQLDLMLALVRMRAKENGIASQTLASHDDLVSLARGHGGGALMKGWRRTLIGEELLELLQGELCLSLNHDKLIVIRRER